MLNNRFTSKYMFVRIGLIGVFSLLFSFTLQAADWSADSSVENSGTDAPSSNKLHSSRLETTTTPFPSDNEPEVRIAAESGGFYVLLNREFNKGNVILYTLIGVQVVNKQITTVQDYIEVPSSGIYIVKVMIDSKESIHKILIK
jgi:hypothetical protein